jgi:cytidylate kinase
MKEYSVISLDGPAGSGKSTLAAMLAAKLGYIHADSGAIYRTLTLRAMESLGTGGDHEEFGRMFRDKRDGLDFTDIRIDIRDGAQVNLIRGEDVGGRIRTPEVTSRIRYIADDRGCREEVNALLRGFSERASLVVDGRDIGSVVFPDTPYKFYVEASVRVRAGRRRQDFEKQGKSVPLAEIEADIARRDEEDRSRPYGALRIPDGAILIDTSLLGINDALGRLLCILQIQF